MRKFVKMLLNNGLKFSRSSGNIDRYCRMSEAMWFLIAECMPAGGDTRSAVMPGLPSRAILGKAQSGFVVGRLKAFRAGKR